MTKSRKNNLLKKFEEKKNSQIKTIAEMED